MKFQKVANNSYDKVENVADDSIINTGDEGSNEATESQEEAQLEIREINLEEMGEESEDTTENNTMLKVLNHQNYLTDNKTYLLKLGLENFHSSDRYSSGQSSSKFISFIIQTSQRQMDLC